MQQINLGMIGGGTVGSGVFHALQLNGGLMAQRIGVKLRFARIAVKAFDVLEFFFECFDLLCHRGLR